ncbi:MAG TPA: hypothetical protein VHX86_08490 [Tepidisphaeraceae bacterium]|jgi:hypothetical protein|nr:hypothetical protein [Tepidisphaeraceae bacterium]
MKRHELLDKYATLSKAQRLAFLCRLAAELTVCARDTYMPGSNQVAKPERLRAFNELQHRLTGHLRDLATGNRDRYPDDVICGIIFEGARELDAEPALRRAIQGPPRENHRSRSRSAIVQH